MNDTEELRVIDGRAGNFSDAAKHFTVKMKTSDIEKLERSGEPLDVAAEMYRAPRDQLMDKNFAYEHDRSALSNHRWIFVNLPLGTVGNAPREGELIHLRFVGDIHLPVEKQKRFKGG